MHNPIQWVEIAANDLERAKEFYGKVFGLEFQFIEMQGSRMYMFGEPDKQGSAGTIIEAAESVPSANGSIVYFASEDVDVEAKLVAEAGGQVIVSKTSIGDFGFFAQFIDTEGNRIGMHSPK
jgi:predicted enzyme related to lactoylglutathione lyase